MFTIGAFIRGKLAKAVSSRPYAKAYLVERTEHGIQETIIDTLYLGEEEKR
ncbi:hypothetical protein [Anoxybacteroides tepidamans]|uniref:hypothetical protein n=1 Tax=Anoxybacteroides tepidamans TaxID=265948 RepID=UPI000AD15BF9|nr:hypothetical protein [Anoxybacillus tepidamans]